MPDVYRAGIRIDSCTTIAEKSMALGGCPDLLRAHRRRGTVGFPRAVARVGNATLYVEADFDAFYRSVIWRHADRAIADLLGA
jgi:hypothetical protein